MNHSETLELSLQLLRQPSVTPVDHSCQNIMADRLEKIGFNKDYIYGKLPQKNDSINFQNYEKTYALNSKYVVFNLNNSEMKLFKDSIQFNSFAKQKNLKNSNGLKTFEDIYSEIIKKNRWKKYLFLQY